MVYRKYVVSLNKDIGLLENVLLDCWRVCYETQINTYCNCEAPMVMERAKMNCDKYNQVTGHQLLSPGHEQRI
jgi:hypothetical protein